jgi:hypothetical protein
MQQHANSYDFFFFFEKRLLLVKSLSGIHALMNINALVLLCQWIMIVLYQPTLHTQKFISQ